MVQKSEIIEKLRSRNLFDEIKKQTAQIQDSTMKNKEVSEEERDQEFEQLRKNIFGD